MLVRIHFEKINKQKPQIKKKKDGWTIHTNWLNEWPVKVKRKHQIDRILKKIIDQDK